MANGMRVRWEKGSREPVGNTNSKTGKFEPRLGKNKGPIIKQLVVKIIEPR